MFRLFPKLTYSKIFTQKDTLQIKKNIDIIHDRKALYNVFVVIFRSDLSLCHISKNRDILQATLTANLTSGCNAPFKLAVTTVEPNIIEGRLIILYFGRSDM